MEAWFDELKNNSHRDQLSFNYVSWKNEDIKITYLPKRIYDSEYFKWRGIHSKIKPTNNMTSTISTIKQRIQSARSRTTTPASRESQTRRLRTRVYL